MLEILRDVPDEFAVGDAMALMNGLTTLRPKTVVQLMDSCQSVKAKRLFMLMSEAAGHRWVNQIHRDELDLGSGKRVLGGGGHYYSTYEISLPEPLTQDTVA